MSHHSLIPYVEGSPVDLTTWAYAYRKGDPANPPETAWLWPRKYLRMEVVNGSMVWYYKDSVWDYNQDTLLCGYLWEEPRDVKTVTVEFLLIRSRAAGIPTIFERPSTTALAPSIFTPVCLSR